MYSAVAGWQCSPWQCEEALTWLEGTVNEYMGITAIINGELLFDPLRNEPRFKALIRKLGLA